jgi:hypothetical protein
MDKRNRREVLRARREEQQQAKSAQEAKETPNHDCSVSEGTDSMILRPKQTQHVEQVCTLMVFLLLPLTNAANDP